MHPVLFSVGPITVHIYGFLIALGAFLGFLFLAQNAKKKLGIEMETVQMLAILIILSAFIGGKIFFYFEKPSFYFGDPANMFKNFKNGFVFYGSLIFVIPTIGWYFKKNRIPVWPMMDLMAFTGLIIHFFGRLGCFFAGCCYGKETDGSIFITFSNPSSVAPLDAHLHPTQLYSAFMLLTIFVILWMFKRHQRFEGQLFFIYIMMYAFGRSIIEIYRGDIRRGFVIEDWISHSQMISIVLIAIVGFFYVKALKSTK